MVNVSDILTRVREDVDNVVHHTEKVVQAALAVANEKFTEEKAALAAEVRKAAADAQAVIKADSPEIEAAIRKGAADLLTVVEAALKAHGL